MMMGGFGPGMGSAWLFWLLLLVGIVLLRILAVRFFFGGRNRGGTGRGELSTEEYTERLRALADGT